MSTEQLEYNSILQQIGESLKPDDYILQAQTAHSFTFIRPPESHSAMLRSLQSPSAW